MLIYNDGSFITLIKAAMYKAPRCINHDTILEEMLNKSWRLLFHEKKKEDGLYKIIA